MNNTTIDMFGMLSSDVKKHLDQAIISVQSRLLSLN